MTAAGAVPPATEAGVSVAVAVFNGAETLAELARRLEAMLAPRGVPWELVLVNDGSADDSWQTIESLARRHSWVRGIDLARNVGQHNALLCAIRKARYRVVITLDDDLQHAPEDIPRLLDALGPGVDVVYGVPLRPQQAIGRIAASWLLGWLLRLWGRGDAPRYSAFRAFRTRLRDPFVAGTGPHVCIDVLLNWSTTRFARVDVVHRQPNSRRSRYRLGKLTVLAHEALVGFGITPAGLAALIGLCCLAVGGAGLLAGLMAPADLAAARARSIDPVAVIILCTGLQLLIFSWFATFVTRLHEAAMGRPPYVIARTTDDPAAGRD